MDMQHVKEIFKDPVIRDLEISVLHHWMSQEHRKYNRTTEKECIKTLLKIRKKVLDRMFVMNEESKQLLAEFNDAMSDAVLRAASQAEQVRRYNQDLLGEDIEVVSKCFLDYGYPQSHPVQTIRSKKIWAILNGTIDNYCPYHDDGVIMGGYTADGTADVYDQAPKNNILYLQKEIDNWNEGLDPELTKDMHLTFQFHNLYDHTHFSIFDLLWVRNFEVETTMEHDWSIGKGSDDDELDWDKCDYYDD